MTPDELFEKVEFLDEDLVRSVTDEMVYNIYDNFASEKNNEPATDVVQWLIEQGHSADEIYQGLQHLRAVP